MYLSQMPDKYDTYTEPTPAINENDITLNLYVKVENVKGLQQLFENDQTNYMKTSYKNLSIFFAFFFQPRVRRRYFRGLYHVSAGFYRTVWRISNGKSVTFAKQVFVAL